MENNSNENEDKNWKDILSKEWNKDFATLTMEEFNLLLQNIFYQYFMIQLEEIEVTSFIDSTGHKVKLKLVGEAYRDSDNIPNYLLSDYEEED